MKHFVNIYIVLFLLYYLQGTLFVQGGWLSRLLLVIVLIISVYYFFYANIHFKLPKPLKILTFMLLIWSVYGIVPILYGAGNTTRSVNTFEYIKQILISLLPIYAFFVFAKKSWLTEEMIKKWFVVFLAVAIAGFYQEQREYLNKVAEEGLSNEEFTNNAGYVVLSLIPLLPLFQKKPILQYIFLGVCMLYVLLGFKRGAILIGAVCSTWLVVRSFMAEKQKGEKKTIRLLLTVLLIIGAVYAVQYLLTTSDYFTQRIENTMEGNSSGRDELFSGFYNHFINETNPFVLLFGNGAYGTIKIFSNYAHNDWIEIAIDNGFIFIFLYSIYWISLFVALIKAKRGVPTTIMLGTFIIIYFFKTFFSMSYNSITPYAACALGFALANYEPKSNKDIYIEAIPPEQ